MWLKLKDQDREKFISLLTLPEKESLFSFLRKFTRRGDIYIVGGAVRDFFLERKINDLDLTLKEEPEKLQLFLAQVLSYTPVSLSKEFGIYRLAKGKHTIDLSLYRGGTISEDLKGRDFTINAMAIPLSSFFELPFMVFDPLGGFKDLKEGIIRAISEENLIEDPLRILRGYRFYVEDYGKIEKETRAFFKKHGKKLLYVAPERIQMELKHLLLSSKTYEAFLLMEEDGIFEILFPEFNSCKGLPQPSFHHLDVFSHCLESLKWTELILSQPEKYLGLKDIPPDFKDEDFILSVKLASLFHDLGKGYTFKETEERITFYTHEKVGAELWEKRGKALRFKNEILERVYSLIRNHMRPCHLLKEWEEKKLTLKAKRNLIKAHPNLYELWVVALSDSLAAKGPDKEPDYEEKLNAFFQELLKLKEELERVEKKERLITGKDLIELGFKPGPIFREILEEVEVKTLEGYLKSKEEALNYVFERYGKSLHGRS
jgi:poly(A) polymerase